MFDSDFSRGVFLGIYLGALLYWWIDRQAEKSRERDETLEKLMEDVSETRARVESQIPKAADEDNRVKAVR